MNDLCADIGYKSINHVGEELCGDHVDVVGENENSTVIVLADGLGSGVKASILSTLTSKIISTMMAAGLPIEECVSTIAATLPVCSLRGVAYSTFTIIHLLNNEIAEIIQYDNPHVIIIRDFEIYDYPKTEMNIGGKKIYKSIIHLREDDTFDYVIANINRNILLADMGSYAACMHQGSVIFISGFYTEDMDILKAEAARHGLRYEAFAEDKNWAMMRFVKE